MTSHLSIFMQWGMVSACSLWCLPGKLYTQQTVFLQNPAQIPIFLQNAAVVDFAGFVQDRQVINKIRSEI